MEPAPAPNPPDLPPAPLRLAWLRLFAGIQAGQVGGLASIAWFIAHSRIIDEPWWSKLNVASAIFFGRQAFSLGPGRASLAGAALLLLLSALAGALFGALAAPGLPRWRFALLAMLFGIATFVVADRWFWPNLHFFSTAFFPRSATFPAHLFFALGLLAYPNRYEHLAPSQLP